MSLHDKRHPYGGDRNPIKCCKNCKPPKRHLACHDICEEYLEEKARYEHEKAIRRGYKNLDNDIFNVEHCRLRKKYER